MYVGGAETACEAPLEMELFDQRLVGGRLAEDQVCRVSPKTMLRVLCEHYEWWTRFRFEEGSSEPLQTVTRFLPGWSVLMLRLGMQEAMTTVLRLYCKVGIRVYVKVAFERAEQGGS